MTQEKKPKNSQPNQPLAEKPSPTGSQDVVLIHGVTEDKKGLRVLRARPDGIELGEVRPIQEGQPLNHDLIRLQPREGTPHICDVHTEFSMAELAGRAPGGSSRAALNQAESETQASRANQPAPKLAKGPAQVATQTYRDGWDAIWSPGRKPGSDLN